MKGSYETTFLNGGTLMGKVWRIVSKVAGKGTKKDPHWHETLEFDKEGNVASHVTAKIGKAAKRISGKGKK